MGATTNIEITMKMFQNRKKVSYPAVIIKGKTYANGDSNTQQIALMGDHYRIKPTNEKEVMALAMAEHQVDKFAPVNGEGIIVTMKFLAQFDS
jgi:hypothetical protein